MKLQLQETFSPLAERKKKGGGMWKSKCGQSDSMTDWCSEQIEMKCLRVEAFPHLHSNQIKPSRTEPKGAANGFLHKLRGNVTASGRWSLVLVQPPTCPLRQPLPHLLLRHFAALLFKIDSWMSKMAVCLNLSCSFLAFHLAVRLASVDVCVGQILNGKPFSI